MTKNNLYQRTIGWYVLKAELWLGKLLNLAGVPGIVRDCDYRAELHGRYRIRVHLTPLSTVISVNGLDVFMDRLTGRVRGIGHDASSCRRDEAQQCIRPEGCRGSEPMLASN
jgi:hypothetical protein